MLELFFEVRTDKRTGRDRKINVIGSILIFHGLYKMSEMKPQNGVTNERAVDYFCNLWFLDYLCNLRLYIRLFSSQDTTRD